MPALPRNCYNTQYGFLFRVVVPEALRPAVGKREIKKSLGKDYREAVSQARILSVQVDRQFNELREKSAQHHQNQDALGAYLATPADKRLKAITEVTPELVAGLRSLWLASLEADRSWRREGLDDDAYDELEQNITQVKGMIAKALARGQPDAFMPVVRNLLVGRGYQLAVSPEDECKLVLDVLPAMQEGYDILEQRQAGRLVEPPKLNTPPLRAAWEPAAHSAPDKGPTPIPPIRARLWANGSTGSSMKNSACRAPWSSIPSVTPSRICAGMRSSHAISTRPSRVTPSKPSETPTEKATRWRSSSTR
jgi:DNA-binding TFAR19-related protein (PDSD5 family)